MARTLLVEMDIDTGNSPPIASRPYTLPLKHYEWVRNEITTLERAEIRAIDRLGRPDDQIKISKF